MKITTNPTRAKRLPVALLAIVAGSLALLVSASAASAAPTYGVELSHTPSTVTRSDLGYAYRVKVKNTSPSTLTCLKGVWSGTAPSFAYQWLRDGAPIAGATVTTYSPVAADENRSLQCQITATTSTATAIEVSAPVFNGQARVPASPAPTSATAESSRPTIEGSAELICKAPGSWVGSPAFSLQWLRNGVAIAPAAGTANLIAPAAGSGDTTEGSNVIANVPTGAGFTPTQTITGAGIPGATTIVKTETVEVEPSVFKVKLTLSKAATATATGVSLSGSSNAISQVTSTTGTGTLASGSKNVSAVSASTGAFKVGQSISGTGIPGGNGAGTLAVGSKNVTGVSGTFVVGEAIFGNGIPAGATVVNVGAGTLELSAAATVSEAVVLTAVTKIAKVGAGTLELSVAATATGAQSLSAGPQPFAVGEAISGAGIPAGTTITGVAGRTMTLSNNVTAGGSAVAITATATTAKYLPYSAASEEDQNKIFQCMATGTNASGTAVAFSSNREVGAVSNPPANTVANTPATSGGEWISGTTVVSLSLPQGLDFNHGSVESSWGCAVDKVTCTTSVPIPPGATAPTLQMDFGLLENAPDSIFATAAAFGAANQGSAQDLLALSPAIPFEFSGFAAAAIDLEEHDVTQAGAHPWSASAKVEVPRNSVNYAVEDMHEIWTDLPVGFLGNPLSIPVQCDVTRLEAFECPNSSAAGFVQLRFEDNPNLNNLYHPVGGTPVYRLKAEKGYPAEFGFIVGPPFVFRVKLRSDTDYGLTVIAPKTPQISVGGPLSGARFTFCEAGIKTGSLGPECLKPTDPGANAQPLLSNGTKCAGAPPTTTSAADSWQHPGANLPDTGRPDLSDPNWSVRSFVSPPIDGCEKLVEAWVGEDGPTLSVQPDNTNADTPAGYTAHLHVPQDGLVDPDRLASSHLDNTIVALAQGPSLNPSVGDGISTCSEAQMGLIKSEPIRFDLHVPHCPDGSKLGNARVDTPLLENPLRGSIYLAAQNANPFHTDYAIYLAIEEPDSGIVVKLAGKVVADPVTGQLTTYFTENPQLPFEDLTLQFFGGGRSSLANPTTCGTFTTHTDLTPWSAVDPDHPQPDEIAQTDDPISIVSGPGGGSCSASNAERPFSLDMEAGSRNAIAGASSPFSMRLTRPDGTQELSSLTVNSPPGYSAYLKGIPACSEAQIKAAEQRSGLAEREHPSCPASSRLGSINAGAGAGPTPLFTPGNVYLGGPYKGAPLSLVTITPALAGADPAHPSFDLGNVVVRVAIYVDRQNASITAKTDAIPRIINGIPLRIRDIRVNLDRPDWGLNPTSCDPSATTVKATGSEGATSTVSTRFQVGGCENLAFKPKLTAKVIGGTQRNDHPSFKAELTYPKGPGYANIKDVQVALPHSEFLDQSHIDTVCTRAQAAANSCPKGSIYGYAEAESPLLDGVLKGPVFLKSSVHKLPDLAIALKGPDNQPVEVEFAGRIDSVHGQIRDTIEGLPDVPVSKFVLTMKGGHKGLLVNSRNLCQGKPGRMTVNTVGQNNKRLDTRPKLGNDCGQKKKQHKTHKAHRKLSATGLSAATAGLALW